MKIYTYTVCCGYCSPIRYSSLGPLGALAVNISLARFDLKPFSLYCTIIVKEEVKEEVNKCALVIVTTLLDLRSSVIMYSSFCKRAPALSFSGETIHARNSYNSATYKYFSLHYIVFQN